MPERARGLGHLLRAAVRPYRGGFKQRGTLDGERARPHRFAAAADHELGLAGQVGLVEREPVGGHDRPVGDDLVSC